eukprot:jgi/Ulvmu1/7823/UM004_0052.1
MHAPDIPSFASIWIRRAPWLTAVDGSALRIHVRRNPSGHFRSGVLTTVERDLIKPPFTPLMRTCLCAERLAKAIITMTPMPPLQRWSYSFVVPLSSQHVVHDRVMQLPYHALRAQKALTDTITATCDATDRFHTCRMWLACGSKWDAVDCRTLGRTIVPLQLHAR